MSEENKKDLTIAIVILIILVFIVNCGLIPTEEIEMQSIGNAYLTFGEHQQSNNIKPNITNVNENKFPQQKNEQEKDEQQKDAQEDGDGEMPTSGSVSIEELTEESQNETASIYELSNVERDTIECVVMGMAGYESVVTQKAIAQCILNACNIMNKRPDYIIKTLRYPTYRPNPSDEVKESVSAIFDNGEMIVDKTVMYLYSPSYENSEWHETQYYVCTIGSYRFFKER